jgi:hypothetical protein
MDKSKGDWKLLFKIVDPRGRAAVRAGARGLAPTQMRMTRCPAPQLDNNDRRDLSRRLQEDK